MVEENHEALNRAFHIVPLSSTADANGENKKIDEATKFLNSRYPKNGKELKDIMSEIRPLVKEMESNVRQSKARQESIKGSLPTLIKSAYKDSESHYEALSTIESKFQSMYDTLSSVYDSHYSNIIELISPLAQKLVGLNAQQSFLQSIIELEMSSEAAKALIEANKHQEALDAYLELSQKCYNCTLVDSVLKERVAFLASALRSGAQSDLEAALKALDWPRPIKDLENNNISAERKSHLKNLTSSFSQLIRIQQGLLTESSDGEHLWAIKCLTDPLIKRFKYHFSGDKKTNRADKPEWVFNYVLGVLRDHSEFLQGPIQGVLLNESASSKVLEIFVDSINTLLLHNLNLILQDETNAPILFSHLVDEILEFESVLRTDYDNDMIMSSLCEKRVLDIITTRPDNLQKWIEVDLQLALDSIRKVLEESNFPWKSVVDSKTVSSESVIETLELIRSRYQYLEFKFQQRFLHEIQKVIIKKYAWTAASVAKKAKEDDKYETYCGTINALSHLRTVLSDWNNSLFYLELQDYIESCPKVYSTNSAAGSISAFYDKSRQQIGNVINKVVSHHHQPEDSTTTTNAASDVSAPTIIGPSRVFSAAFSTVRSVVTESGLVTSSSNSPVPEVKTVVVEEDVKEEVLDYNAEDDEGSSVFESEIKMISSFIEAILSDDVETLVKEFKSATFKYKRMKSFTIRNAGEMSWELQPGVEFLIKYSKKTREHLNASSFLKYVELLLQQVDDYWYEEVIDKKEFSAEGASQLGTDVALFKSVLEGVVVVQKENSHVFAGRTAEAINVVTMKVDKAQQVLGVLDDENAEDFEQISSILEVCSIGLLSASEVTSLLKRRRDIVATTSE